MQMSLSVGSRGESSRVAWMTSSLLRGTDTGRGSHVKVESRAGTTGHEECWPPELEGAGKEA